MSYSAYKTMIDTHPNLRVISYSEDFRRYLNVQLALIKIGEAVENYTLMILGDVQTQIVQRLQQQGTLLPCTNGCSQQHSKHNLNRWCQTCKDWKSELETFFVTKKVGASATPVSLSTGVQWHTLKSWQWHTDARKLAEVFVQPGWNTTNLNLQDLSTASGIWIRCNLAHDPVRQAAEPLKAIRNQLAHKRDMKLTENETRDAFAKIIAFLNVPEVKATLQDPAALETTIRDLEQDCFTPAPAGPQPPLTSGLIIVPRQDWEARRPKTVENMGTPVSVVIIHHSGIGEAYDQDRCAYEARHIQNCHMDERGWDDVGYNFLIGEDGRVYEGRGWNRVGAHTFGWNRVAVSLCFMGDYTAKLPGTLALGAAQLLIDEGLKQNKIATDYKLYGHRDLRPTGGPGQELYSLIQSWLHYDHSQPVKPPEVPYTP